jgi:hypothetical protein
MSQALRPIAGMTEAEFEALLAAISGARSFSLSKDQIAELTRQIPVSANNLPYMLGTLAFLYSQISQQIGEDDVGEATIAKLVEELDASSFSGDDKEAMSRRLKALLERRASHQIFAKTRRLQRGFIPNATGFSSFVDLRPNFNDGVPTEVVDFLPLIQFRISTDADRNDQKRFVFQLSPDSLGELQKAIERAQAKLEILMEDDVAASRLKPL